MAPKAIVGDEHAIPENLCTKCGHYADRASGLGNNSKPEAGSVVICIKCGHAMAFTADLNLRELTKEEQLLIENDPRVVAGKTAVTLANLFFKPKIHGKPKLRGH